MTADHESFPEQLARVTQMAEDVGDTWDLSMNDQAAIKAVLDSHASLLKAAHAAFHALKSYQYGNVAPALAEECAAVLADAFAQAEAQP